MASERGTLFAAIRHMPCWRNKSRIITGSTLDCGELIKGGTESGCRLATSQFIVGEMAVKDIVLIQKTARDTKTRIFGGMNEERTFSHIAKITGIFTSKEEVMGGLWTGITGC